VPEPVAIVFDTRLHDCCEFAELCRDATDTYSALTDRPCPS